MKIGGCQYLNDMDVERFLYFKSLFVIKGCKLIEGCDDIHDQFMGQFEGVAVFTESFKKGKYKL